MKLHADRLVIYGLATLSCFAFAILGGKDLSWDQLNYHFYAGFSLLYDRVEQDFFPASLQSYLNPLAYVPFVLMVQAGLPDWLIGSLLAVVASLALWAVYELSVTVAGECKPSTPRWLPGLLGVALAFTAPVFLVQVGSSFADATTATLVLWAYVLVLRPGVLPTYKSYLISGFLLGAATGLKLTNFPFALAALAPVVMAPGRVPERLIRLLWFSGGGLLGVVIAAAPWALKMQNAFANPVFPLLNSWFKSPAFPAEGFFHSRYVPVDWQQALLLPFRIALPERYVYTETIAPDIRFLALFTLLAAFVVLRFGFRNRGGMPRLAGSVEPKDQRWADSQAWQLHGLTLAFLVAWTIWLNLSGNGRYFMPMLLGAAPLVVGWVWRLLRRTDWRIATAAALLALQIGVISIAGVQRWTPMPWEGVWYSVDVPKELQEKPILVLSAETQSNSFIVQYLDRRSSFVNVSGQYALAPGVPGWDRLTRLVGQFPDATYFLFENMYVDSQGKAIRPPPAKLAAAASRFGMEIDVDSCIDIRIDGLPSIQLRPTTISQNLDDGFSGSHFSGRYLSACKAEPAPEKLGAYLEGRDVVRQVFSRLEDQCPGIFSPKSAAIEGSPGLWWRNYMHTDGRITISGRMVRVGRVGGAEEALGSVDEILSNTLPIRCARTGAVVELKRPT